MLILPALYPQDKEVTYCHRRADFLEGRGEADFGPAGMVSATSRVQHRPQQRDSGQ